MENKLLVTPEELNNAATNFEAQAVQVKSLHDEMIKKVNSLSNVWTGNAGDNYRNKFGTLQKAMDTINRMILEHVKDLQAMAEQYTSADTSVESIIASMLTIQPIGSGTTTSNIPEGVMPINKSIGAGDINLSSVIDLASMKL